MTENSRLLIIDASPAELLFEELDFYLENGLQVTLNLRQVQSHSAVRNRYGARLAYQDFDAYQPSALADAIGIGDGFRALKTRANVPINAAVITRACHPALGQRLQVIAQAGVGVNHIDLVTAEKLGVAVKNTPGSNADAVAEFVIAQILALSRGLIAYNDASHAGIWAKSNGAGLASDLRDMSLGLVGLGDIGRKVVVKAQALGMRVLACSSARFHAAAAAELGVEYRASLDEVLCEADMVSLHVPLNAETRGMVGERELRLMKTSAGLINTARGELVDEEALAAALSQSGWGPCCAAIDTFQKEKAAFATPLQGLRNALLTPHIAGSTRAAVRRAALEAGQQIVKSLLLA